MIDSDDVSEEEYSNLLEMLLEAGVLQIVGFDKKTNQMTYGLTPKCKEVFPELFEEHFKFINEMAFKLWNEGIIEMTFAEDGTPMVMVKDYEYTMKIKELLPDEERFFLENLIYKHEQDLKDGGII